MLWLASYPRSGNTFCRIVLSEVYGIKSSEFHNPQLQSKDRSYLNYPVVKTHLLPDELLLRDSSIPAVYLVRDGRDVMVSKAWHKTNIVDPGSNFYRNLFEVIWAPRGGWFGGWSQHVRLWRRRAAVVIRFEDLIVDPVGCIERVRPYFPLPRPKSNKVPSFSELKSNSFQFGKGDEVTNSSEFRQKFFRRGISGAWKDEMSLFFQLFFQLRHGRMLRKLGYY